MNITTWLLWLAPILVILVIAICATVFAPKGLRTAVGSVTTGLVPLSANLLDAAAIVPPEVVEPFVGTDNTAKTISIMVMLQIFWRKITNTPMGYSEERYDVHPNFDNEHGNGPVQPSRTYR